MEGASPGEMERICFLPLYSRQESRVRSSLGAGGLLENIAHLHNLALVGSLHILFLIWVVKISGGTDIKLARKA